VRRCEQEGVRRPRSPDAVGGPVTPGLFLDAVEARDPRVPSPIYWRMGPHQTGPPVSRRDGLQCLGEGQASSGAGALARRGGQRRGHRCLDCSRVEKGVGSFISSITRYQYGVISNGLKQPITDRALISNGLY
jgi:hypothetical protein